MAVPTPQELVARCGRQRPERLAKALGFRVTRAAQPPVLPGVTVLSAFDPVRGILLYREPVRRAAEARGVAPAALEQRLIAHELYHGLAERTGRSAWQVREADADRWAETLLSLLDEA